MTICHDMRFISEIFEYTPTYVNTVRTKMKCPQNHRWLLFRDVHKTGLHCIPLLVTAVLLPVSSHIHQQIVEWAVFVLVRVWLLFSPLSQVPGSPQNPGRTRTLLLSVTPWTTRLATELLPLLPPLRMCTPNSSPQLHWQWTQQSLLPVLARLASAIQRWERKQGLNLWSR